MPIHKSKYEFQKVWRPNGSRYAEGNADGKNLLDIMEAIEGAINNFAEEFDVAPDRSRSVVEITFSNTDTMVSIFEFPRNED